MLSDHTLDGVTANSKVPLFFGVPCVCNGLVVTIWCQNLQSVFSITRVATDRTY